MPLAGCPSRSAHGAWPQRSLADILSVLAMTMGDPAHRATLRYRLAGSDEAIGSWGHEYVRYVSRARGQTMARGRGLTRRTRLDGVAWPMPPRYLASEVIAEYNHRASQVEEDTVNCDDLLLIARELVPFNMQHNAEADACDLLMELERIGDIVEHVDKSNYARVCLYLTTYGDDKRGGGRRRLCRRPKAHRLASSGGRVSGTGTHRCVNYVPEPEDDDILKAVLAIYQRLGLRPEALTTALRMNDLTIAQEIFETCPDMCVRSLGAVLDAGLRCADPPPPAAGRRIGARAGGERAAGPRSGSWPTSSPHTKCGSPRATMHWTRS